MYELGDEEIEAARRVMTSGRMFRYLDRTNSEAFHFEQQWSSKIGVEHTIAVNSGTSALICGLIGMGIGPGDEVIIPGYTFVATAIAVATVGATPVVANIDASLTIDPSDIEVRISECTKAIIPVHMRGFPCDMEKIMSIAERHDLGVIEDACQAAGGTYRGKKLGSIGHAGAFSFNFFKTLSCGEGGAVCTSDRSIFERSLIYHDSGCAAFGRNAQQLSMPPFPGQNYRISEVCAAIMIEQTKRLDSITDRLRKICSNLTSDLPSPSVSPICGNDSDGECGTAVAWRCDSRDRAEKIASGLRDRGYDSVVPLQTGKHVFRNWSPLWSSNHSLKRAMLMNEGKHSLNATLDHLGKTVLLMPTLNWKTEDFTSVLKVLRNA